MFSAIRGFIRFHADFYSSISDRCGNGVALFERNLTQGKVYRLKAFGLFMMLGYNEFK